MDEFIYILGELKDMRNTDSRNISLGIYSLIFASIL